ncbi:D-glycerate dehydrogenase [Candidatus Falkowbacteria bacterium CG10_big_fil_rev_8_21_14_0_10_39_11]|uniref:D-glycerate dehydrogenase n=1 Tax=Candidatus Falkowbacteria bacterium CG10_big_fil_rev_8_21_14_0_10_39_11 TaxID=1974565 RepID=A0A2H0V3H1_9BACT|nr:MAG: D-glycerate dehydrogenase [Candidatus Falkowbacteria bacterium CG10_big_fil_rev_8_21_14_0_10_39_11]
MKKVFVTRQIPDVGIKMLKQKGYQVKVSPYDRVIKKRELVRELKKGYDALFCLLTDKIDGKIMDVGLPRLKVIANYAVGFDNIDLNAAKERKLIITNTPSDQVNESVAEHVISLMFTLAHRVVEADNFTRAGKYKGWQPDLFIGQNLMNKTMGIIGLGRIGKATVRRAQGMDMTVIYHDLYRDREFEKKSKAKFVSKADLLKKSDFISLNVPLLDSTRHLMSTKEFKQMKKTAFIINTARGPVVDELALVKALTKGEIAGAGLDVYECEPLIDCNPRDHYELRKMNNVIMTPHTASATIEAREAMATVAAKNIIAALSGRRPPNQVKFK